MRRVSRNDAIDLEHIVRKLYKCDRMGVFSLIDSDFFETEPIVALVMVMSYIYTNNPTMSEDLYTDFVSNSKMLFDGSEDEMVDASDFIGELSEIVNNYV